ncbi:hypothetical protein NN561_018466 [Cricetulus griseus]
MLAQAQTGKCRLRSPRKGYGETNRNLGNTISAPDRARALSNPLEEKVASVSGKPSTVVLCCARLCCADLRLCCLGLVFVKSRAAEGGGSPVSGFPCWALGGNRGIDSLAASAKRQYREAADPRLQRFCRCGKCPKRGGDQPALASSGRGN